MDAPVPTTTREETPSEEWASLIAHVAELLDEGQGTQAFKLLGERHPADMAEILEQLDADQRLALIDLLRPGFDAEILAYLDPDVRDEVVERLEPKELAAALEELEADDAVGIIEDFDPEDRARILANLPEETRLIVEQGLTFPEDSAGRLMQRELVSVPQFWTVGKTLEYLRAVGDDLPEDFYDIFIVDPRHRVVGTVPLGRVLRAKRSVKLEEIKTEKVHAIPAAMDQEEVAFLFRKYALVSAPVVDAADRLIGAIMVDDVVDVIEEEAQEDILALTRVGESDLYAPTFETAWRRIRWLLVTLINTIIASFVISRFEATIEQIVVLAILMPIVAAMGGNAGMQAVTVTVRGLATKDLQRANTLRIVGKELAVGVINGLVFAAIMGSIAALWFDNPAVAGVLALAMVCNMIWAGLAGTLIPLALARYRIDPAIAAGPFLTTTTDVLGFLLFLGLATVLLL